METREGSVLCDPWFNPAYYGSWFPFPDNSGLDPSVLGKADYLYISHLHRDHFDPEWLRRHMSKRATVLLPDYPVPDLRDALEEIGFRSFIVTRDNEITELDGDLRVMITTVASPADGEIGDSAIALDDGQVRIFNQNDARPIASRPIEAFGPLSGHFLQYSGAIWFPMVYEFPDRMKSTLGRRKRKNGMSRALQYINQYGAAQVFPFAGPPCFLDDDLFHLNDFANSDDNTFPDQMAFLDFLTEQGVQNAHLFLPGTVVELGRDGSFAIEQVPQDVIDDIYQDRTRYMRAYQARSRPKLDAERASWPSDTSDLLAQLKEWIEPLLAHADHICAGVNGRVLFDVRPDGAEQQPEHIVFDFLDRRVKHWAGEDCRYAFRVARPLVEDLVRTREQDWVNHLFLSCRFAAQRKGAYNEYVFSFLQAMSPRRLEYVERYYAEQNEEAEFARAGEFIVQRHCPHLGADLERFGVVSRGVLTCQLHGWQFDLATGNCLTSDDRKLVARFEPASGRCDLPSISVLDQPATAGRGDA
ncbi:Rieske 2Fe-2S domain-containing protein [Paractinoplanes pyxinae]|uniref:Rieske 2Fe-2S domain-containing protein n=1 Tax=Paractinoplanes pyxinae TaxID=2997416 RepID=UPI002D1E3D7C|nr:Rieske 2Fe-2S domain-containing protein [Actinoplanes pyxinae]